MSTPRNDEGRDDLRYAEYVLGVLDADARAAIEREMERDPRVTVEIARWQQHFSPLAGEITPVVPPAHLWPRLRAGLDLDRPRTVDKLSRRAFWNNLPLWRGLAFATGLLAIAFIGITVLLLQTSTPPSTGRASRYLATTLRQNNGVPAWTATVDPANARVVLVPAAPSAMPAGRVPELWLIPSGGKPIAVGVFAVDRPTTLKLAARLLSHIDARASLAVSVEPTGGSPTGQPTGTVVGAGVLSAG